MQVSDFPDPYATWDTAITAGRASDEPDGWPDSAIIPLVEHLRAAGIVTLQSCAGHEGFDGHLWIAAHTVDSAMIDALDQTPFTAIALNVYPSRFWTFEWRPEDRDKAMAVLAALSPGHGSREITEADRKRAIVTELMNSKTVLNFTPGMRRALRKRR